MDVPRRILVLVGDNAQGKTSLLEAVYYLATFDSFQAQTDRQLVNFLALDEPLVVTRLVAGYQRKEQAHRMEVRLIIEAGRMRREILVDGVKRTAHEAIGSLNAVLFLPGMTRIIEGAPDERRRYLNLALAQVSSGYARALSDYHQALTQRNALLKQLGERGGDAGQLLYWDEILSQRGAVIISARIQAIREIERLAARVHDRLTHGREIFSMVYQPSYDPAPQPDGQMAFRLDTPIQRNGIGINDIQTGFARRLQSLWKEEIQRGVTTIGPHRDELRMLANGIDLGDFGSRGQIRSALLALKMAETQWMQEKTGETPILLLDETLAELDIQRRADLLDVLQSCDQAMLTTTDLSQFLPEFVKQSTVWQVSAGCVTT